MAAQEELAKGDGFAAGLRPVHKQHLARLQAAFPIQASALLCRCRRSCRRCCGHCCWPRLGAACLCMAHALVTLSEACEAC